jgi:hypothetical protein
MRIMTRTKLRQRTATVAVLAVGGGAVTVGTWLGGQHGLAVGLGLFYLICMVIAYLWAGGDGDVAAILRVSGDERQRALDLRATAISGLAMGLFCIGGLVVDLARGGSGNPWALVCAVGGLSYAVALAGFRRRG